MTTHNMPEVAQAAHEPEPPPAGQSESEKPAKPKEPTAGEALAHAWSHRREALAEARRLVAEGPAAFRAAPLSAKIAALSMIAVIAAAIANVAATPSAEDSRRAMNEVGGAFGDIGAHARKAAEAAENSGVSAVATKASEALDKTINVAASGQPEAAAGAPTATTKASDAPHRP